MDLKRIISKKSIGYTLVLMVSFSLAGVNQAYSETKQVNSSVSSDKKDMHILQVLVETYAVDHEAKYPIKVKDMINVKGYTVSSSGEKKSYSSSKDIAGKAVDYSDYEKANNKVNFKNKLIYKPVDVSRDNTYAANYQIYLTDNSGNFTKDSKNEVYYLEGMDSKAITTVKEPDNFSNPDGYIDSQYGYTYFALTTANGKPTKQEIIDKSLEYLNKGVKTQQIYSNLYQAYSMTKQFEKAKEISKAFIKEFPNSAQAYSLLAFENSGEEAIKLQKKAVELAPKNPLYRTDLASLYYNAKNYQESLNEYKRAKELAPEGITVDEEIVKLEKMLQKN